VGTATQQMYQLYFNNLGNEIVALQSLDTTCIPLCAQLPGQSQPTPYNYFLPQFSSLWGWRTAGNSSYNALNISLRHALSQGVQFDVNYTYSRSIDVGSNAEWINVFDTNGTNAGGVSSQVINAWEPNQLRAASDFDMTHQVNANWIAECPWDTASGLALLWDESRTRSWEVGACPACPTGRPGCLSTSSSLVGRRITTWRVKQSRWQARERSA
jgi:hypothetical protein